jgi:hypothetical protein
MTDWFVDASGSSGKVYRNRGSGEPVMMFFIDAKIRPRDGHNSTSCQ